LDQKAPPAALIPIATRSLPVGAISSFKPSAKAGAAINAAPSTSAAARGTIRLHMEWSSSLFVLLATFSPIGPRVESSKSRETMKLSRWGANVRTGPPEKNNGAAR
jgi:hypothetical protein